jgi:hypothetical protein
MSENLVLDGLSNGALVNISKVVEENIRKARAYNVS